MFIKYFYQPFFNILVGIYWVLGQVSPELQDMGIAVILFSIIVRILTFPLTLASERSEKEKHIILEKVEKIKKEYSHDPIKQKQLIKKTMYKNHRIVISTFINLLIQLGIIIMLYRIFTTGLEGKDYHLLYSFMPNIDHVNLMFLGKYDLSHTNPTLNLIQSAMIFVVELLIAIRSSVPISRKDVVLMQFVLPIASYIIFMFMPAGKKIFIITSLMFSAIYHTFRIVQTWLKTLTAKIDNKLQQNNPDSDVTETQ